MIPPGQTIGVLGAGPLTRMLTQAAQDLGYKTRRVIPISRCSVGGEVAGDGNSSGRDCAVVTHALEASPEEYPPDTESSVPLRPSLQVMRICQDRLQQRHWLGQNKFPQVRCAEVADGDVSAAVARVGRPCLVKTADLNRSAPRPLKITTDADLKQAAMMFHRRRCVVERWVDFACELTALVARTERGEARPFPLTESLHSRQGLDICLAPARVSAAVASEAQQIAAEIASRLSVVGLVTVEFFLSDHGELLVNEIAPGPHPSCLWSLDGCETSQFEQNVRAVCGLPLGSVAIREPTATVNLRPDLWRDGKEPDWTVVLAEPKARLYLYGENEVHAGRALGYFSLRAGKVESVLEAARWLKAKLTGRSID